MASQWVGVALRIAAMPRSCDVVAPGTGESQAIEPVFQSVCARSRLTQSLQVLVSIHYGWYDVSSRSRPP